MKHDQKIQHEYHNYTLRLTQFTEDKDKYRIEIALEGGGLPRQTATSHYNFKLTDQDQEDIRWYLEDFLQYPHDPAPKIAARIEKRMAQIGTELFKALFQSSDDARDLWATLRTRLNDTRIEIITTVAEATAIPWELIRDPKTDVPLALRARSFVHAQPQAVQVPQVPQTGSGPIRILLVICRPGGRDDVPFRSVATHLIKGLSEDARAVFQLEVLRPPTFKQLGHVLRRAKAKGQPYHIIHFDGHGAFLNMEKLFRAWKKNTDEEMMKQMAELLKIDHDRFSPTAIYPRTPGQGDHGYLIFENPQSEFNYRMVDGQELGKLLVETDATVLVLNACRSSYANPLSAPAAAKLVESDPHAQVRALGSLAQEAMDAGATGVVAMRYNVYVATAAQFMADLYAELTTGRTLGEAVTSGRKQLAANPLREIAFEPYSLQDWSVPVVYEAAPISLFPVQDKPESEMLRITLNEDQVTPDGLDPKLPGRPDAGFFGRDETLLALDRAFDTQQIVLLHAYAGSGKTATAAEFARWYKLTGGVQGPVLFTSFEQYRPLSRVLDQIGDIFGGTLEQAGIHWLALDDENRRNVALQVLKQIPVLWIWDNVEPVAGFPAGTESAWSTQEQQELSDFLRSARDTQAKFLLTSRRDEQSWLGNLPHRIKVPPMPMQERVQLARAIIEKYGRWLSEVKEWRVLLEFTQGNPLTITVLVGQALREGWTTEEQIKAFVERLRYGEAEFKDEVSEGRSKSLSASLSYGFEHAFSEEEHRQLALLQFFQGFVNVDVLRMMGDPDSDWCLLEVRGLTSETGIKLLNRAAEIGLLTAIGGGYYVIHPALPRFFESLFDKYYASAVGDGQELRGARAFVEAMGKLGDYYHHQYNAGNRDVIAVLSFEEANLLYARKLARMHGWWDGVISTMQGLQSLYDHTGRRTEWTRLVNEIVPDFVDQETDGPLPGREEEWGLVTEYRVLLAKEARQWTEAGRLQRACVDWDRKRAATALTTPLETLDSTQRNDIRTLVASLHELGEIQRELGKSECVDSYKEAIELAERIGDKPGEAICAYNLGNAYLAISALRNLEQAELWYRRSLELFDERDKLGQAKCLNQLGNVARERFEEARTAKNPEKELKSHINDALQYYNKALEMTPLNAVNDLAVTHNQLGLIYHDAGDLDHALSHYRDSIRYNEVADNLYGAALTRYNVARALVQVGRITDGLEYAHAALRGFETYGDRASEEIHNVQRDLANWPCQNKNIVAHLKQRGCVTISDLSGVDSQIARAWLETYLKEHSEESLVLKEHGNTLYYENYEIVTQAWQNWQKVAKLCSSGKKVSANDLLPIGRQLSSLLFLTSSKTASLSENGSFSWIHINVRPVFEYLKIPSQMPIIMYNRLHFDENDANEFRHLLRDIKDFSNSGFALLLHFLDSENFAAFTSMMEDFKRVSAYDIIPMAYDDFHRIVVAKDSQHALRRLILSKADLDRFSPFVGTGPTPDHMFFGREHELREIREHAADTSYALIGGRRIGKSSILGRLQRFELPRTGFRACYFHCQRLPKNNATRQQFLEAVVRAWFSRKLNFTPSSFADVLEQMHDNKPIVFLIDETDRLIPADLENGWPLFSEFRALSESRRCQFVFAGERMLSKAIINDKSPLFNFANLMLIRRLDYNSVEELITRPMKQLEIILRDEADIVQNIWDATSGHPNVVQRLCQKLVSKINKQRDRRLSPFDVESVVNNPDFQENDFFAIYLEQATMLEQILVLIMAQHSNIPHTVVGVRQLLDDNLNLVTSTGEKPLATEVNSALHRLTELRAILVHSPQGYIFSAKAFLKVFTMSDQTTVTDKLMVLTETYQIYGDLTQDEIETM
jgi:tetratricopeptide (TPR) repeat protein